MLGLCRRLGDLQLALNSVFAAKVCHVEKFLSSRFVEVDVNGLVDSTMFAPKPSPSQHRIK